MATLNRRATDHYTATRLLEHWPLMGTVTAWRYKTVSHSHHLVGCEQLKVVWRVGDDITFGGRVLRYATHSVAKPIQANTEDSERSQGVGK